MEPRQSTHNAYVPRSLTLRIPILGVDLLVHPVLQQCANRGHSRGGRVRRNGNTDTRGCEGAQEKTSRDDRVAHYGEIAFCISGNDVEVIC